MPRKKFVIAPDAARRHVDCAKYSFNGGAPRCEVLNHPWCLAPGQAPETCAFRPPTEPAADAPVKASRPSRTRKASNGEAD